MHEQKPPQPGSHLAAAAATQLSEISLGFYQLKSLVNKFQVDIKQVFH